MPLDSARSRLQRQSLISLWEFAKGSISLFLSERFELLTIDSFGFVKYLDVRDSELCIRGFYKLGYKVHFARVCILTIR